MSAPADRNIALKEFQEFTKGKAMEVEVGKMWQLKRKMIITVLEAEDLLKKEGV